MHATDQHTSLHRVKQAQTVAVLRVLAGPVLKVHLMIQVLDMDVKFEPFSPAHPAYSKDFLACKYPRRSCRRSARKTITHGDAKSLPGYL